MTPEEAYRILEVPPGAGAEAVQEAYRKAALRTHPDKASGYGLHIRKEWLRVRDAYECLRASGFPELAPAAPPEPPAPRRYRAPDWLERKWASEPPERLSANLRLDEHESRALRQLALWIFIICGAAYLLFAAHQRFSRPRSPSRGGLHVSW